MTGRSATRAELEKALRSLLPAVEPGESTGPDTGVQVASAGVGGLFVGYLWGWWRGRRGSKKK